MADTIAPAKKELSAREQQAKNLEAKIKRLKSGELNAEESEGDGRQESTIARTEAKLRETRKLIAAEKK